VTIMRFLLLAAVVSVMARAQQDVTVPLDDGTLLVRVQFIRVDQYGSYIPELALKITNQTSSPWVTLKLQFNIGGLCNGEPRQWTLPVATSLGWMEDRHLVKEYTDYVIPLVGKVDRCKAEVVTARLLVAENSKTHIDGVSGERVDLEKQLQVLKTKRDAEAAAQAEADRKAAEAQATKDAAEAEQKAKRDATETARQKRLAAERKQKEAEDATRRAKINAEEDAKAAEERRKIRAACTTVYQNTIDKKVKDLTVREEQQVRACQTLDLYPPH
jgi:hypothetical protein